MAKKTVKKKAATAQSTVKPTEAKTVKKEAAPVQSAVKPVEAKPAKKETAKPVEVKTAAPAKSAAKPAEAKVEVYLQFGDREVRVDEIMKAAQEDFHGKDSAAIQSVQLYLKPEDCAAYYVANGAFSGKVAM